MKRTRKPAKPVSAEAIAGLAGLSISAVKQSSKPWCGKLSINIIWPSVQGNHSLDHNRQPFQTESPSPPRLQTVVMPCRADRGFRRVTSGREQAGHRPVLVLSPARDKTGSMLCCPMTTQVKAYPFEVLTAGVPPSVVLADQVKSLDWRLRKATRKGTASPEQMAEVHAKILALIGG